MGLLVKTETIDLRIRGMTCGNCVAHVTHALEGVPGVKHAEVYLESGTARVVARQGTDHTALASAVAAAGYAVA